MDEDEYHTDKNINKTTMKLNKQKEEWDIYEEYCKFDFMEQPKSLKNA